MGISSPSQNLPHRIFHLLYLPQLFPHYQVPLPLFMRLLGDSLLEHLILLIENVLHLEEFPDRFLELLCLAFVGRELLFIGVHHLVQGDDWLLLNWFEVLLELWNGLEGLCVLLLEFLALVAAFVKTGLWVCPFALDIVDLEEQVVLSLQPLLLF